MSSSDRSAESPRRTGRARRGDGRDRARGSLLRHRRARRNRPRLARARHLRSRGAQRRDLDRTGARRRGGRARGQRRHQLRGRRGRMGPLARSRSSPQTASPAAIPGFEPRASAPRVIGGEGTGMERDYDYSQRRLCRRSAPTRPRSAGAPASARSSALARARCRPAGARWCSTRGSRAALSAHLLGAITGPSIARGTSFLKDRLGAAHLPRGDHHYRRSAPPARPALASRSTARASPTIAARSSTRAC